MVEEDNGNLNYNQIHNTENNISRKKINNNHHQYKSYRNSNYRNNDLNNFNSCNNTLNYNTNSNMNSILFPLNNYDSGNELSNHNLTESGNHINDMIKNLQNKMKLNSKINKKHHVQSNDRMNTIDHSNNNKYKEEDKNSASASNSNFINYNRSSNISQKISELKNKFKSQKYQKFNVTDTLTSLNTHNSEGNTKKELIENAVNISKEKEGKSNKYQQSIKFFNEARVILKKDEFDELVFLIKSINQGKISIEEFDEKIDIIVGSHPSLIRDLPNVVNVN